MPSCKTRRPGRKEEEPSGYARQGKLPNSIWVDAARSGSLSYHGTTDSKYGPKAAN